MTLSVVSDHECSLDQRIDGVVVLMLLCKIRHKEACSSPRESAPKEAEQRRLLWCDLNSHIPGGAAKSYLLLHAPTTRICLTDPFSQSLWPSKWSSVQ